jgi:hypothetical protein
MRAHDWDQEIGKHLRSATAAGVGEQAALLRVVLIREERPLASIAPLGVAGQSRHDPPGRLSMPLREPPP